MEQQFIKSAHKWKIVGDTIVSVTTQGPIPQDIWEEFIKDLKRKEVTRWLSAAIGYVEANSVQRKMSIDVTGPRGMVVAVVTDERLVRGMVTAASWLGVKISAFSWDEMSAAVRYLGSLAPAAEHRILVEVNHLRNACLESPAPPPVVRRAS